MKPFLATRAEPLLRADGAMAPHLWLLEVRSALLSAERRGRAEAAIVTEFLDGPGTLPITVDHGQDLRAVIDLTRTWRLTVYDAAYLELARRRAPAARLARPRPGRRRTWGGGAIAGRTVTVPI